MATSPLKAVGALDPSFFGAEEGSDYSKRFGEAKEAEQRLMAMLERRNESRLNPSMLALAGELLDPGRTGSFGEALGRGAKSYAAMQAQDEKQLQDNAMMRMQLANMRLENAGQAQMANMAKPLIQSVLGGGKPAATAPAGGAVPAAGGAAPTLKINGQDVNPDIIAAMKMVPSMKNIAEALETQYKLKLEAVIAQPGYMANKLTGEVTPVVAPGGPDVEVRFPEKGGASLMGSTEDLIALRKARNIGDVKEIDRIWNKLKFGATAPDAAAVPGAAPITSPVSPQPLVAGQPLAGAAPEPNAGAPTIQEKKERDIRAEAVAKATAEDYAKETTKFLKDDSTQRESAFTAARILKNAQDNPQMFGLLKDPGIGTALASFIREKGEAGQYAITKENLEDFLRKAKFDTTKQDMTRVAQMASDLARLHFNFRRTYFSGSGQGSVSDREDSGIARIMGTASDTPEFLMSMAQLTGRRSQFDVDVAAGLRKYQKEKGESKTLEDYRRDSSDYKRLLTGYENWLTKTFSLPAGTTPETRQPSGPPPTALKEGVETTFQNGQVWTKKNGVPVRVK